MRLTSRRRQKLESVGQASFLDDLDATLDAMLAKAGCPDEVQWTDSDIATLKQCLLKDSLQTLRDSRITRENRDEILDWISQPLAPEGGNASPFSFEDCCIASDLLAEEMRSHLLRIFAN